MLRCQSPAMGQPAQGHPAQGKGESTKFGLGATPPARRIGGAIASAASIIAFAATSGVSAESLAQPRDTALERAAADYVRFREDVAVIEATPFNSAETTREAHRRLSAHTAEDLSAGWVAYAALVAADTPAFREALEKEVSSRKKVKGLSGADAFFAQLAEDPAYPRKLKGADEAMNRVLAMTTQDAARFTALGESFKEQAYAMQKTSWGKAKIPSSSSRLSDAETYARARPSAAAPTLASTTQKGVTTPGLASANAAWNPEWGKGGGSGQMTEPNAQVIMNRVLNLASRYAVSGVNDKTVAVYARNDKSNSCLSFATLTLKQCIAATRAPYEEAFCLGEHALNDVASCIGWVAGVDK
ncbi:MAG: hypothetical protein AB7F91_02450 [Parvularculaceae bacterium]